MVGTPLALGIAGLLAWSWPFAGLPSIEAIKVSFHENSSDTCQTKSLGEPKTVKKSDQDILIVRIANDCDTEQTVKITHKSGILTCVGEPYDLKLGADFSVKKQSKAYLVCTVKYTEKANEYPFQVSEKEVTRAGGGQEGESAVKPIRVSELALEPVP